VVHSVGGKTLGLASTLGSAFGAEIERVHDPPAGAARGPVAAELAVETGGRDLVFLGGPIWASRETAALRTVVSRLDLEGALVVLVFTYLHHFDSAAIDAFRSAMVAGGVRVIDLVIERFPIQATATEIELRARHILRQRGAAWLRAVAGEEPPPEPIVRQVPTWNDPVEMCLVSEGLVWEGCIDPDACFAGAPPARLARTDELWIDRHEVTLRAYSRCVEAGVCDPTTPDPFTQGILAPELPVVSVNLRMARRYCRWNGQRLPTEAEWQRAARGSRLQAYPWGESVAAGSHSLANLGEGPATGLADYALGRAGDTDRFPGLAPPCALAGDHSLFGLCDMAGNVMEWVEADSNRRGAVKGGSWLEIDPRTYRISSRVVSGGSRGNYVMGFRCASDSPEGRPPGRKDD